MTISGMIGHLRFTRLLARVQGADNA
jgi:hypothetical protein